MFTGNKYIDQFLMFLGVYYLYDGLWDLILWINDQTLRVRIVWGS